jgi:hypothetical protein
MNRIIKFQVWDKNTYKRVYPVIDISNSFPDNYIFQQFTGIFDKNGTEVYDGDIIFVEDGMSTHRHIVEWDEKLLAYTVNTEIDEHGNRYWEYLFDIVNENYEFEVIGNVYKK